MKKLITICLVVAVITAVSGTAHAGPVGVTIQLYASPAPNGYGSPSWSGYAANVIASLEAGSTSTGNPATDPTAFYTIGEYVTTDIAVTGFNSWEGVVNPSSPFDNEYGQRLHFPWVISSITALNDIKLSNVGNMDIYWKDSDESTYPLESAAFGDAATYRFTAYSSNRVGIMADGTIVNSGASTQLVNKIIYTGYGMAWADYHDTTGTLTDQEVLDNLLADLGDGSLEYMRATVNYYYSDSGVSPAGTGAELILVPEPATICLLGLGGLFLRRRK
jgi:hypothetical protein